MNQKRSSDVKSYILNSCLQNEFMTFNISVSLSVNNKYALVAFTNEFYIRWPITYLVLLTKTTKAAHQGHLNTCIAILQDFIMEAPL